MRFPKILALGFSFCVAGLLYQLGIFHVVVADLNGHGYISAFIGGLLFSFGFTAPFGLAMLIETAPEVHPFLGAIIGGIGALCTDFFLFETARWTSIHEELHQLKDTRLVRFVHSLLHHENISDRMREYILWSFAGLIIASPLPDEIGVSLVGGLTQIRPRTFAIICFVCNTLGILVILAAAHPL